MSFLTKRFFRRDKDTLSSLWEFSGSKIWSRPPRENHGDAYRVAASLAGLLNIVLVIASVFVFIWPAMAPSGVAEKEMGVVVLWSIRSLTILLVASLILMLNYMRMYYRAKHPDYELLTIGNSVHMVSEAMRAYRGNEQGGKRKIAELKRNTLIDVSSQFNKIVHVLFGNGVDVIYKMRTARDEVVRLSRRGRISASLESKELDIADDYCYHFMKHIKSLSKKSAEREVIIFTDISENSPMPENFDDVYCKSPSTYRPTLHEATSSSAHSCWTELCRRITENQHRSLLRMHINDHTGYTWGIIMLGSTRRFTFHHCRKAYIEIMLSVLDQLSDLMREYPKPEAPKKLAVLRIAHSYTVENRRETPRD